MSNWFANARRRLKNTVRQPDLSWALRIKLYNKYVQGNAERLSVSSDDSCSEGLLIFLFCFASINKKFTPIAIFKVDSTKYDGAIMVLSFLPHEVTSLLQYCKWPTELWLLPLVYRFIVCQNNIFSEIH